MSCYERLRGYFRALDEKDFENAVKEYHRKKGR